MKEIGGHKRYMEKIRVRDEWYGNDVEAAAGNKR